MALLAESWMNFSTVGQNFLKLVYRRNFYDAIKQVETTRWAGKGKGGGKGKDEGEYEGVVTFFVSLF